MAPPPGDNQGRCTPEMISCNSSVKMVVLFFLLVSTVLSVLSGYFFSEVFGTDTVRDAFEVNGSGEFLTVDQKSELFFSGTEEYEGFQLHHGLLSGSLFSGCISGSVAVYKCVQNEKYHGLMRSLVSIGVCLGILITIMFGFLWFAGDNDQYCLHASAAICGYFLTAALACHYGDYALQSVQTPKSNDGSSSGNVKEENPVPSGNLEGKKETGVLEKIDFELPETASDDSTSADTGTDADSLTSPSGNVGKGKQAEVLKPISPEPVPPEPYGDSHSDAGSLTSPSRNEEKQAEGTEVPELISLEPVTVLPKPRCVPPESPGPDESIPDTRTENCRKAARWQAAEFDRIGVNVDTNYLYRLLDSHSYPTFKKYQEDLEKFIKDEWEADQKKRSANT